MADVNDFSDISVLAQAGEHEIAPSQLPTRGERRVVPTLMDPTTLPGVTAKPDDFAIRAALRPFTDYVVLRILHRGLGTDGTANPNLNAYFRFLINPSTLQVSKQTVDSQSLARGGWQFGVWGESFTAITMSGKTAGQYFANGLTDFYEEFTLSYRNLQQLQLVFDNNGYWFEGETANDGPLAADFTRRRIKMHEDVQLLAGNFIWYGMFEHLTVSQDAESPFLANFSLQFTAWKERYRSSSPYQNSRPNAVQRGHAYGAYEKYGAITQQQLQSLDNQPSSVASDNLEQLASILPNPVVAPAETQAKNNDVVSAPTGDTYSPTKQISNPANDYWNGYDF